MPERKHRNPFEDHINSEAFDVSHLRSLPQRGEIVEDLAAFFKDLDQPLDNILWQELLDERQQLLCMQLCEEMVVRVLRPRYGEAIEDLTDEQLVNMLLVPTALSMIIEEKFHHVSKTSSTPPEQPTDNNHPLTYSEEPQDIGQMMNDWFLQAVEFMVRLFKRR